METVVGSDQVNKVEIQETNATKSTLTADPVVYQLVRVEGDGRLVPATDDEVMEVEELLEVDKCEIQPIPHIEQQVGPLSNAPENSPLKISEECENKTVENFKPPHTTTVNLEELKDQSKEVGPSSVTSANTSVFTKPDFSKLKGKICLNILSVRELHETFKATFGRETSVKDKQWLKRRISMGLTNSCNVSTTKFIIDDKHVVKICKEEETCEETIDDSSHKDPVNPVNSHEDPVNPFNSQEEPVNPVNSHEDPVNPVIIEESKLEEECKDDLSLEERAAKRVRKPTKRYIEEDPVGEFSEEKSNSSIRYSGEASLRKILTRPDSLVSSGVQVPNASRAPRSRPRKNYISLMKLQPSGLGIASPGIKKSFGIHESAKKPRQGPLWVQPVVDEPVKDETTEKAEKVADLPVENNTEENMPTAIGDDGMRRKHHRAWSLAEVVKLVEGVAKFGAGKWSEIKRLSFTSYPNRTSVDLKDKWRNLLRASFSQSSAQNPNSRKKVAVPVPESILARVKELAESQAQVPSVVVNLKSKLVEQKNVQETRPGYL